MRYEKRAYVIEDQGDDHDPITVNPDYKYSVILGCGEQYALYDIKHRDGMTDMMSINYLYDHGLAVFHINVADWLQDKDWAFVGSYYDRTYDIDAAIQFKSAEYAKEFIKLFSNGNGRTFKEQLEKYPHHIFIEGGQENPSADQLAFFSSQTINSSDWNWTSGWWGDFDHYNGLIFWFTDLETSMAFKIAA